MVIADLPSRIFPPVPEESDVLSPRALLTVTLLLAPGMMAATASAQQGQRQGQGRDQGQRWQRESAESLSDSVRRVERDRGGQVLGAERIPYDGRDVNRVKWVDDRGRVRVYMDDPRERGDRSARRGESQTPPPGRERDGDD